MDYYSLMNKSVYFQDDCFSLEVCLLTVGNYIVIFTAPFIQICTEVNVTKHSFKNRFEKVKEELELSSIMWTREAKSRTPEIE